MAGDHDVQPRVSGRMARGQIDGSGGLAPGRMPESAVIRLELDPVVGPTAGAVSAVEPLGDDPFDVQLLARIQQSLRVTVEAGGGAPASFGESKLLEYHPTLAIGEVAQRAPLEPEDVERDEADDWAKVGRPGTA